MNLCFVVDLELSSTVLYISLVFLINIKVNELFPVFNINSVSLEPRNLLEISHILNKAFLNLNPQRYDRRTNFLLNVLFQYKIINGLITLIHLNMVFYLYISTFTKQSVLVEAYVISKLGLEIEYTTNSQNVDDFHYVHG